MGGFLIAGLNGPLVTVGLGKVTAVVIITPLKHPLTGGSTHYKRRVRTVTIEHSHKLRIMKSNRVDTNSAVQIYNMIREQWDVPLSFKAELEKAFNNTFEFSTFVISKTNNVVTFKERHISKSQSPLEIKIARIVRKISRRRVVKSSKDTEVLNTEDILDTIEAKNLAELIKALEDLEGGNGEA